MKAGDRIETKYGKRTVMCSCASTSMYEGLNTTPPAKTTKDKCAKCSCWYWIFKDEGEGIELKSNGGNKMRNCIKDVFKKTDDAVLVDDQFSSTELKDDFMTGLLVEQNKTAILTEAKRRATPVKETGED